MDCSKTIDFFVETHRLCASRGDCKLSIDDRCPLKAEDDSFSNVELQLCGSYDKENPRTEITIKER